MVLGITDPIVVTPPISPPRLPPVKVTGDPKWQAFLYHDRVERSIMNDAVALPSPSAFRSSVRRDDAVPMWLGLAGGFVLPMIAAALYATYEISMRSPWLEQTRQLGYVWLLGELLLILHAARRGFTVRAVWATLPRWVRTSLALFLSTFWISSAFVSRHPDFSLGLTIGWALQLLFAAALAHLVATVPVARLAEVWRGFALGLAALALAIAVHFTWLPAALRGWEREIDGVTPFPGSSRCDCSDRGAARCSRC